MRLFPIAIAAGTLVLAAAGARAQDTVSEAAVIVGSSPFSPLLNGALADPLFLPPKGRLYGSGVSSLMLGTSDAYDPTGAKLYSRDRYEIGLAHALAYGLTSRLSLHGSLGYSFDFADDTAPDGAVTRSSSHEPDNSGLGLTWRAVDQRRRPFVVDLTVNYSPTLFIRDPSLRQALSGSVGIGRAMRNLTVQVIGSAAWRPTHRYVSDDRTTDVEQRSTLDYTLALRTQVRFSRSLSTDMGVNYAWNAERVTIDRANQLSLGEGAPAALTLSIGAAYQLITNKIAVGAYYSRQFQSSSRQLGATPAQDVLTRNAAASVISGKLYYVID
jgi:hypothetical protein